MRGEGVRGGRLNGRGLEIKKRNINTNKSVGKYFERKDSFFTVPAGLLDL